MSDPPPRQILLVEDDVDQRELLADLLRTQGYGVTEASSAERALEELHTRHYDLLVTDYQLGGATGTWLARVGARTAAGSPRPTLLITAHSTIVDADGFTVLRKPLDAQAFLREVGQALAFAPIPVVRAPSQRIAIVLYVNGSLVSQKAERTLAAILAKYEPDQVAMTTVDVTRQRTPQLEEHRIVVTPTLVRTFPAPPVWIAGTFEPDTAVCRLLEQAGVERRSDAPAAASR